MSEQTFKVEGLHCQSCVRVVSAALEALPAVSGVAVDLGEPSIVRVQADSDLSVAQVQAALDEEGEYSVVA
ncbi:heavy-metal-associated domain-containing protein [Mycolicibacterium anyangense]|uniref:heavy-metal-associated domain-containing protein n=1 Tax=Mycolicibacterium anyangense TaxID=1431246 RepID=UPI0013D2D2C9|nr:heavy metal-associated domain-containing protein [Mycolicibacterium anyangense]